MEILITGVAFGAIMLAMASGVLLGRKPLKGSCGGPDADCPCSEEKRAECAATKSFAASSTDSH